MHDFTIFFNSGKISTHEYPLIISKIIKYLKVKQLSLLFLLHLFGLYLLGYLAYNLETGKITSLLNLEQTSLELCVQFGNCRTDCMCQLIEIKVLVSTEW